MQIPYYHVDAFTTDLFAGNPAGVCLLENWLDDAQLQSIAAENNLSETAFVVPADDTGYDLRWFTPATEVDLCGHATLAAAFVLDLTGEARSWPIIFTSKSGELIVTKDGQQYFLDFPSRPAEPCSAPDALIQGLGDSPDIIMKSRDYLAVFAEEEDIIRLEPDYAALAELDCLGIIATAPGKEVDFVSRFFAPGAGVPEDPVTGSSHCTLIPYWAEQLGKQQMVARQLSQRSGELFCHNNGQRVLIGGNGVLYLAGHITI